MHPCLFSIHHFLQGLWDFSFHTTVYRKTSSPHCKYSRPLALKYTQKKGRNQSTRNFGISFTCLTVFTCVTGQVEEDGFPEWLHEHQTLTSKGPQEEKNSKSIPTTLLMTCAPWDYLHASHHHFIKKKKDLEGSFVVVCPKWNITCEAVSAGSISRSSKPFTVVYEGEKKKKKRKKKKTIKKKKKKNISPNSFGLLISCFTYSLSRAVTHTINCSWNPLLLWSKQKVVSQWGDSTTCKGFTLAVNPCDRDQADKGRPHCQEGKKSR